MTETPNLPALREAVAKMTEGPWTAYRMTHHERGDDLTLEEIGKYVRNSVAKSAEKSGSSAFLFVSAEKPDGPADVCHVGNGPTSPQNAAGIVALRNAAPALLDEVEALRAVLDTARWPGTQRDDEIVVLVNAAAWQAWRARKEHL